MPKNVDEGPNRRDVFEEVDLEDLVKGKIMKN